MTKFFTDAQLLSEINRCEFCEEKPCRDACPVHCSPADFIIAAKLGNNIDYQRAAGIILSSNPLGGVCGAVCPDYHCMAHCTHKEFDSPLNIPKIQSSIINKAKNLNCLPSFHNKKLINKKIAVIGSGPSGLGSASVLAQLGYTVEIFEKKLLAGGACNYIPDTRLDKNILQTDIEFLKTLGNINFKFNQDIKTPEILLQNDFDAVIVCVGLDTDIKLGIPGEEHTVTWMEFLENIEKYKRCMRKVAVIGGGAVAADCVSMARLYGATEIDLICLEKNCDMPLTDHERQMLLNDNAVIISKTTVTSISKEIDHTFTMQTALLNFTRGGRFNPELIIPGTKSSIKGYDLIIKAIGNKTSFVNCVSDKGIFYAGDVINGPTTVVEAVASGKNAADKVHAFLNKQDSIVKNNVKNYTKLRGWQECPVSLKTDFFGREIISPFILSAAPSSDGYDNMKKAYEAGWAGGVMKTAFDNIPIHIPAEYMFVYNGDTYANCDNVSGHSLDRMCREIEKLVIEYPDRLTMGSTGGPVTGNDENDKKQWQMNTIKLERAGAMGIEYSLSCPQGGDGTEGDIVSQNAKLTAKIIDWIMEVGDKNIPKLFKLTAAVTSIYPIISAIKQILNKYPHKYAGVTLANSFPTVAFRKGNKTTWEEGIVVGMSGMGVKNISYLTLANVSSLGVNISGNGGPMDYKDAADFLALGVKTVQFCTIVLKYGVNIIEHLHSGISYLMKDRGFNSVQELIGCALPSPITGFMDLNAKKKISAVYSELCQHCGNCTRCPYLAITLDKNKIPVIDPAKCIGCSLCTQKCFAKALYMKDRNSYEMELLSEC